MEEQCYTPEEIEQAEGSLWSQGHVQQHILGPEPRCPGRGLPSRRWSGSASTLMMAAGPKRENVSVSAQHERPAGRLALGSEAEELQPIWTKPLDDEEEERLELHPVEFSEEVEGWVCSRVVPDTGAVRSVCPERMASGYEVKPSQGSLEGREFVVANGGTIPHQGEIWLPIVTNDGVWTHQRWDIAPVTRPLLSTAEECDKGMRQGSDSSIWQGVPRKDWSTEMVCCWSRCYWL